MATGQFKSALILLVLIIIGGTASYVVVEGWNLFDAFYMTIISITTTGFAEIRPLTLAGRVVTVVIIVVGVSTIAYTGGRGIQILIESQLLRRRRLTKKVEELTNHYIICGYGRLGRTICTELSSQNIPFMVIEKGEENIKEIVEAGFPFIQGDATLDEVLLQAGINRARGILAVLSTDAENVYVTLSARVLNSNIFIVTRALEDQAEEKLKRAGANRIVMPYEIGATRMVHLLLRPAVVDFMDIVSSQKEVDLNLEEIEVSASSPLVGKTLVDSLVRQKLNIIIVAIFRADGAFIYNPTSSTVFQAGDRLIAIGASTDLNAMNNLCR